MINFLHTSSVELMLGLLIRTTSLHNVHFMASASSTRPSQKAPNAKHRAKHYGSWEGERRFLFPTFVCVLICIMVEKSGYEAVMFLFWARLMPNVSHCSMMPCHDQFSIIKRSVTFCFPTFFFKRFSGFGPWCLRFLSRALVDNSSAENRAVCRRAINELRTCSKKMSVSNIKIKTSARVAGERTACAGEPRF